MIVIKSALRLGFTALLLTGIAAAPSRAEEAFNESQKAAMETIIHDYIIAHPEVLLESVNGFQAKQAANEEKAGQEQVAANKDFLHDSSSPFAGNKKGKTIIVEFFDYNCGYCKMALKDVVKLIDEDKDVKVIFKELPIFGDDSAKLAKWALAAHKQGKYFEFHKALMENPGHISVDSLPDVAQKVGLNVEKMKKDAEDPALVEVLKKNHEKAGEMKISGTPAFIIGDKLIKGYVELDGMKKMIEEQRTTKK